MALLFKRVAGDEVPPCDFCGTAVEGEPVCALPPFDVEIPDVGEAKVSAHICERCARTVVRVLGPRARAEDSTV